MATHTQSMPKVTAVMDGEEDVIAQYQKKLRDQDKANMVSQLIALELDLLLVHQHKHMACH
jgi:hypothetical protein